MPGVIPTPEQEVGLLMAPTIPESPERFMGFEMTRPDRGWGGAYGQYHRAAQWSCVECGMTFRGEIEWLRKPLTMHFEQGHTPCQYCDKPLLNRKDGTPRQHGFNRCPGKSEGFKIEREFVKNMTTREFA